MPRAPPLVLDGGWLASILGSSSGGGSSLVWAPRAAGPSARQAPSPSPLLLGGVPLRALSASAAAEDGVSGMLKSAQEKSVVRHELFQEAMGEGVLD